MYAVACGVVNRGLYYVGSKGALRARNNFTSIAALYIRPLRARVNLAY